MKEPNTEIMIAQLQQMVRDLADRYGQDRIECRERYERDREEARKWRGEMDDRVDKIEKFMAEFQPNYKRALVFSGLVIVGAISIIWRMIWNHVSAR